MSRDRTNAAVARGAHASRTAVCLAAVLATAVLPAHVSGQAPQDTADVPPQVLPLLRHLPDAVPGSCPAVAAPIDVPIVDAAGRQEAERLATEASNAAILGDLTAARDLLTRAATLDPSAPNIAFRLARSFEELEDMVPAVAEYCRYLRLAPDAPDAAEVNATVQRIAPPVRPGIPDSAVISYQAALDHADEGRLTAAADALTSVIVAVPDWPVAWHDRGVVNAELRQRDAARNDFARYLELAPAGASSETVRSWLEQLEATDRQYSPGTTFMAGLIPGAGHFYTGRPAMGALFLLGAGGAAAAGMLIQERHIECLGNPQGGVCPPDQVRGETVERPYMMVGLGAAAAATLLGALDAARGARSRNADAPIIRFGSGASGETPGLLLPDLQSTGSRLDLALLRFRF